MAAMFMLIALMVITQGSASFIDLIPNAKCMLNNIECCRGYTCKSWGNMDPICVKDKFKCEDFFDWGNGHSTFTTELQSSRSGLQKCNPSAGTDSGIFGGDKCDSLSKCCRMSGDGWWDDIFGGNKGVCVTAPSYNPCKRYQTSNCKCPSKWDDGWMNKHDYGWDWLLDILD